MSKRSTKNIIHPCECCNEEEGYWRDGGELGAMGNTEEECDRIIDSNAGYFCDECWNKIQQLKQDVTSLIQMKEEIDRIIDSNAGYFCDERWNEIQRLKQDITSLIQIGMNMDSTGLLLKQDITTLIQILMR